MYIKVNVKQIGSRRKPVAAEQFFLSKKPETVRELIVESVRTCVEEYNERMDMGEEKPLEQQQIDAMQGLKSSEVNDEPDDEHDVDDEDSLSNFDKDFVTDADIEDGFTESDGARFERESMIPTEIDDFIEDEEEEADSEYDDYGE